VKKVQSAFLILILSVVLTGCADLFGSLRDDSDDGPRAEMAMQEGMRPEERKQEERTMEEPDRSPAQQAAGYETLSDPEPRRAYRPSNRTTKEDFLDQSQAEGSLWASSGQTNYYFTKNKVRSPGDIVAVTIENDLYRDITDEIKRNLSPRERTQEIKWVQDQYRQKNLQAKEARENPKEAKDSITTTAAAPATTPPVLPATPAANPAAAPGTAAASAQAAPSAWTELSNDDLEKKVRAVTLDEVDLPPSLILKPGDTMLGEIIGRYPNGNYKVRSVKRVPYKKGGPRLVTVVGIVKAVDINEETDLVASGKMYEYRIEVAH
jgi:flagellar basal body L-ring protein FlgH